MDNLADSSSGGLVGSVPLPWQTGFQVAATPVMERVQSLHSSVMIIVFAIAFCVVLFLVVTVFRFSSSRDQKRVPSKTTHNTILEIAWTVVPCIILIGIAIPSLKLISFMDKVEDAEATLKVTGRQWYWSYEYPDERIAFDSTLIPAKEIKQGQISLLSVDNQVVLPTKTNIRLLFTSGDVLHSWAVPSFGIKQDTIPGRLREAWVRIDKEGTYYGQCSELCGAGHGFMPISVKAVPVEDYREWVREARLRFSLD